MLLPLKYNDGRPVENEKILETREELLSRFDAVSFLPGTVQGIWIHQGVRYEDELLRVMIDVDDTLENHEFFVNLKANLCERFQQIEIYMAWQPIERV
jgi:hypothetical protein